MEFNKKVKKDGEGKKIKVCAMHLGGVKQAPYLIRSVKELMPKLKIGVSVDNDSGRCSYVKKIFENDLKYEGIDKKNIFIRNELKRISPDLKVFIDFNNFLVFPNSNKNKNVKCLNLWIDSLKFEKRKLLDKDEIKDLKEKYKIRENEKIVIGGALHPHEKSVFFKATNKFLNKDSTGKVVVVPRKDNSIFLDYLKDKEFNFETDEGKIDGKSKYLVITERGILDKLYALCDVAVMGNSLSCDVGQNPLEPAFYGKKIICGNEYSTFNKQAYFGLKKSGLLKKISMGPDCADKRNNLSNEFLKEIPENDLKICQEKAQNFIKSNQGFGDIYAKIIQGVLYRSLSSEDKCFLSLPREMKEMKDYFKN